ncbi:hypothetical protein BRADO3209 [Bradyrhizobium sp. ORS 278]|nr:hypothetical protein BRADO3209 [Bradyrhizobium sp. ORS 278]
MSVKAFGINALVLRKIIEWEKTWKSRGAGFSEGESARDGRFGRRLAGMASPALAKLIAIDACRINDPRGLVHRIAA